MDHQRRPAAVRRKTFQPDFSIIQNRISNLFLSKNLHTYIHVRFPFVSNLSKVSYGDQPCSLLLFLFVCVQYLFGCSLFSIQLIPFEWHEILQQINL